MIFPLPAPYIVEVVPTGFRVIDRETRLAPTRDSLFKDYSCANFWAQELNGCYQRMGAKGLEIALAARYLKIN